MRHLRRAELEAPLERARESPRDAGVLEMLNAPVVRRGGISLGDTVAKLT